MSEPRDHSAYLLDSDEEPLRLERQARIYGAEDDLRHLVLSPATESSMQAVGPGASRRSWPAPCRKGAPRASTVSPCASTLHAGGCAFQRPLGRSEHWDGELVTVVYGIVVVGTYADGGDRLYISARIVRPTDNTDNIVSSATDYGIPMQPDTVNVVLRNR
jgi:hypothetical protein